jgi:dTMP kinase
MDVLMNFAVLEGGDGTGTSTQMELLKRRFEQDGRELSADSTKTAGKDSHEPAVMSKRHLRADMVAETEAVYLSPEPLPVLHTTCEPTPGPVGRLIRQALKGDIAIKGETLARLFAADRGEHLYGRDGIAERAGRGELVISDRYTLSSLVYQGIDCGRELPLYLNAAFPLPEIIIILDLDPARAAERIKNRSEKEIFEYLDFQLKVRSAYRELAPYYRDKGVIVDIIDSSPPITEVAEAVWSSLQKMSILKKVRGKE